MFGVYVYVAMDNRPYWLTYKADTENNIYFVLSLWPIFPFWSRERAIEAVREYEQTNEEIQINQATIYKCDMTSEKGEVIINRAGESQ